MRFFKLKVFNHQFYMATLERFSDVEVIIKSTYWVSEDLTSSNFFVVCVRVLVLYAHEGS